MNITDKQKAFLTKSGVTVSYNMSSEEASKLIGEIINKGKPKTDEVHQEQPKAKGYDTSSFYVAYSKDLCIALLEHQAVLVQAGLIKVEQMSDVGTMMAQAILCIKQAQKEFQ